MTGQKEFSGTGGLLLLIGAVAYVGYVVIRSWLTAGVDPGVFAASDAWVPVNMLGAVGAVLVLLGLPGVKRMTAERGGLLAWTGATLIEISWVILGVFLGLYGALVMPWLAERAPQLVDASAPIPQLFVVVMAAGLLAWLIGASLLARPFLTRALRPRWVGYMLPASALVALAGNLVIAPNGPASNLAVNLISNLGPVLLLIGLGSLGFRLWKQRG